MFSGGLLQKFDRDTNEIRHQMVLMSEITGRGGFAVAKDPITDKGKRNKPGRLKLVKDNTGKIIEQSVVFNIMKNMTARQMN